MGWSAPFALGAAAQSDAVEAAAVVEPGVISQADEREQAAIGGVLGRTAELATEGRLADACRAFATFPFTDEEIARVEDIGYLEAAAPYIPNLLAQFQTLMEQGDPLADPAAPHAISAPVLVLLGSDTKRLFTAAAQVVTDRVPNARLREITGAGHAAPLTHPEAVAEALTEFFASVRQPA